jgi:hypothetical protein
LVKVRRRTNSVTGKRFGKFILIGGAGVEARVAAPDMGSAGLQARVTESIMSESRLSADDTRAAG